MPAQVGSAAERIMGTEEAIGLLIQKLLKPDNFKLITDLDDEEVNVITLLQTIGDTLKIDVLKEFCDNFTQFRISRFRMGRRELVDIAAFYSGGIPEFRRPRSLKDLFVGVR